MTPRRAVRRFNPALIRHRELGVLGELEALTSGLVATVDRMAKQLDSALAHLRPPTV